MTRLATSERPRPLHLPCARGASSAWVLDRLRGEGAASRPPTPAAGLVDDDTQLALYLAYESHYSTLPGVTRDLEWDPDLIAFRRCLEHSFELALRDVVGTVPSRGPVREVIPAMIEADDGPSLSTYMEHHGTLDQMRQFVVHRSAYQLKEGDAHTFGIPRLAGDAKQLLAEIQAGEYGADGPDRIMHAALFAQTMRSLGLDDRLHAHLDALPGSALLISNLISLFGLNRRWRGALVGHLAVFEMTSVTPMGRYARGLERMGAPAEARRFYDVHILADAEHEVMALDMAAAFAAAEPHRVADVFFGARCAMEAERAFATTLLDGWRSEATTVIGG